MTLQSKSAQPPRLAVGLLNLFALPEEAESILGDLIEEFSTLVTKSGVSVARRWYWRQTLKTLPELAGIAFRTAPLLISGAIVGGFLLRKLLGPLVEPAIHAVLDRYQTYEHHFRAYLFFASTGIDIGHLITFFFIGLMVALAARKREMVATMTLVLFYAAMAVVAYGLQVKILGHSAALLRLTWNSADFIAIVIAGAIVRTRRLSAKNYPANA